MHEGIRQAPGPAAVQEQQEISTPATEGRAEISTAQPEAEVQERPEGSQERQSGTSSAEDLRRGFDSVRGNEGLEPETKIKEYQRLEQSVADRRAELEGASRNEQSQLQETRARLNLPLASQESHAERASVAEIRELDALDQDIQSELRKGDEAAETLERERGLKEGARKVSEAASIFAHEIDNRDREGMDPFMDARSFNELRSGITELSAFGESNGRADMDGLAQAFSRVNSGLSGVEQTYSRGSIIETEESLARLGYAMQNLYEETGKMSKHFGEGDEQVSVNARRLMDTSEDVWSFTSRRRSALRDM